MATGDAESPFASVFGNWRAMGRLTESPDSHKPESASVGPFGLMAQAYAARSLRVFPTGGPDGKKPLIRNWPRVGLRAVPHLVSKFPAANIGVIDGDRGGVARIDIDDPALVDGAIRRFGDSPIKVATPGGGLHLWYRANGEHRVIGLDGEKIDVLGSGGFGIAPPSVRPGSGQYRFLEGGLEDMDRLKPIQPGSLPPEVYSESFAHQPTLLRRSTPYEGRGNHASRNPRESKVGQGLRERFLFREARRLAPNCATVDELMLELRALNAALCDPPLPDSEVVGKARHVWRLKEQGRCYPPGAGRAYAHITGHEIDSLSPDALYLLAFLKRWHLGYRDEFALANAMAGALGWTPRRFKAAIGELFGKEFLVQTRAGGKGHGDTRRVRFGPACNKGGNFAHQYNRHPPFLSLWRGQIAVESIGG